MQSVKIRALFEAFEAAQLDRVFSSDAGTSQRPEPPRRVPEPEP